MHGKTIALTFDDGVNFETTVPILDLLERYGVVASFFVCGNTIVEETKPILRRAFEMGCEVCNHSYSHRNLAELSPEEVSEEVESTSRLVEEAIGVAPRFFRPPYIAIDQTMFDSIELPFIEGYGCSDWDGSVSVEERIEGVLSHARDGEVVLLHDMPGNVGTVLALETVVPELIAAGYGLVTVSELFRRHGVSPRVHENTVYSNVLEPRVCSW